MCDRFMPGQQISAYYDFFTFIPEFGATITSTDCGSGVPNRSA